MKVTREILSFTLVICCTVSFGSRNLTADPIGSAASLNDLLENSLITSLKAGERPTEIQFKDPQFHLIPRHNELERIAETVRKDLEPSVMVETLHLYEKPPNAEKTGFTQAEFTALYNRAIAISTLQGIQYYSASRGAMRTLYEISSVIDGPLTKRSLPDPSYPNPPLELTLYVRQKDLTFGDNIYQYNYKFLPGALIFFQENLSTMSTGIIPAVGKNKLRSCLALLDAGDYLVIYAVSMAKTVSLPGLKDRIGDSFSNRAEAVIQWISSGADRVFGKNR